MKDCKNCNTQVDENITTCKICKYPIGGNEKEQASFIAKQVMQKGDVLESIKRVKTSRMILFFLGISNTILLFFVSDITLSTQYIISLSIGLLLIGFGFLSFKKPKIALLIPLCLYLAYYLFLLLINPMYFFSGIAWKIIIVMGLSYGYLSVLKSDKILKNNKYLASILQN